jgi:hypothetical protein
MQAAEIPLAELRIIEVQEIVPPCRMRWTQLFE